jgi:hypothetical protein
MNNTTLMIAILIIIASPIQATEPLWITETTSIDKIVAALTLPSNPMPLSLSRRKEGSLINI